EKSRKYRVDNPEKVRAYAERWARSPEGRAAHQRYRERNPERVRAASADWERRNRDRRRARQRAWRAETAERQRAQQKARRLKDPERYRALSLRGDAARRARLLNAFVEVVDRRVVLARDEGLCGICGNPVD